MFPKSVQVGHESVLQTPSLSDPRCALHIWICPLDLRDDGHQVGQTYVLAA